MKTFKPYESKLMLIDDNFNGHFADSWNTFFRDFGSFNNSIYKPTLRTNGFEPLCDITESKEHYMIVLDVPGVDKKDISIELENQKLKISGERLREVDDNSSDDRKHYFERSYGKFVRTFSLPAEISFKDIQAHYESGVLKVAIPKVKKAEPQKIEISTEKPSFFQKLVGTTDKT